jgi:hypothetical protein
MPVQYSPPRFSSSPLPVWLGPVFVTTVIHVAFLAGYVLFIGDVSCLVCAGRASIGRPPFEAVRVGIGDHGYDGQFYYVLARYPWQRHDVFVDAPAYRHVRILYPALAWLCSGGDAEGLLWVLPAINLAAIAALGGLGAVLAVHFGRSPYWGVLLPLAVNVGAAAQRDLAEPVAVLTAAGVVAVWLKRGPDWLLGAFAIAAMLSREQNAMLVLIVLFNALTSRSWRSVAVLTGAIAVWLSWIATLYVNYGDWPFVSQTVNAPFAGVGYLVTHTPWKLNTRWSRFVMFCTLLLLLQLAISLALPWLRGERTAKLVAVAGAALALLAGIPIFTDHHGFLRVFFWMPLGIWLWSMQSGRRWPAVLLSAAGLLPLQEVQNARNIYRLGL